MSFCLCTIIRLPDLPNHHKWPISSRSLTRQLLTMSSMEPSPLLPQTPAEMPISLLDDSTSSNSFICLMDVTKSEPSENISDSLSISTSDSQQNSSSPPEPSSSKKKRKSWGQVLPKPTTNLPPRKRAKTDDEKQQRKYERVQRNRHAAHMSRMRKQDEMESLRLDNDRLKQDADVLHAEITRLKEEVDFLRKKPYAHFPSPPASPPLDSLSASELGSGSPSIDGHSLATPPHQLPESAFSLDDLKQPDDTHSAAMCSPQWTSGSRNIVKLRTGATLI